MDNSSPPINYYKNLANLSCEMNSGNRGNLSGWKNHCAISFYLYNDVFYFDKKMDHRIITSPIGEHLESFRR